MSPNGRRAWRKWCKRARLRMNKHHRTLYRGAIMRKKQPERTPFPPKTFTARSLVGMSESAKRRAARAQFVELVFASQGTECKPGDKGPRWFHLWCRGSGDLASRDPDYAALRSKYRIGKRLRPCSGCCSVRYRRYKCGKCGVRAVRLWRPYGCFYRAHNNVCTSCAPPLTQEGRPPWYVPLVIGPQGQIWGFGARPQKDMDTWEALPVSLSACQICDGSGVLPARKANARAR